MASTFAVCRTAEIPLPVINRFLSAAYARSDELAPGLGPCLVVLPKREDNTPDNDTDGRTTATTPGSAGSLQPSPFIGMSPPEVAERLGSAWNGLFLVMDTRSAEDDTVLLVTTGSDDDGTVQDDEGSRLQTVRVSFEWAQSVLVSLDMGTLGFEEVRIIAAGEPGGVYGEGRRDDGGLRKGKPAPRKVLGGH